MENTWSIIEETARQLGVGPEALKKWRQRQSVPHKWRIPIVVQAKGRLSFDAFERSREDARS